MMGQVEGRTEAIAWGFNSQEVANTLWAIFFFSESDNHYDRDDVNSLRHL